MTKTMAESIDFDSFIRKLQALQTEAQDLGLHATARALKEAIIGAGWERADQLARITEEKRDE